MSFIMRPIRFASTGHIIEGSGLFDGSTGYLSQTPSAGDSNQKWTLEFIVKHTDLSGTTVLFEAGTGSGDYCALKWNNTTHELLWEHTETSAVSSIVTTPVFRDLGAYYHIVLAADTTQADAANRFKFYVNGTQITSFSTNTRGAQNHATFIGKANAHVVGRRVTTSSQFLKDYLARFTYIDNQQLAPTDFGEVTDDGFWQINDASGLTFVPDENIAGSNTDDSVNTSTTTAYTFSNQAIGTASADRVVIVTVAASRDTAVTPVMSSLTIGGVTATQAVWDISQINYPTGIFFATVPSGTTADVVATFSAAHNSCGIGVYTTTGVDSVYSTVSASYSSATTDLTGVMHVPAGGYVVGVVNSVSTSTHVWTELTEDFDGIVDSDDAHSGASKAYSASTDITVTVNPTGTAAAIMALVVFVPSGTGADYGLNGFLLEGGSAISAGTDSSGNSNNFTKTGTITATNDSPTNGGDDDEYGNYSTIDPLNTRTTTNTHVASQALTNGNRTTAITVAEAHQAYTQTLSPGGKYHVEQTCGTWGSDANGGHAIMILCPKSKWEGSTTGPAVVTSAFAFHARTPGGLGFGPITRLSGSNLTTLGTEVANGNRVTYDIDMSTIGSTTVKISIEGSLKSTDSSMAFADEEYVMAFNVDNVARSIDFTMNTGSDAFVDTPVTGHVAVSTATQSTPAIINPEEHFHSEVVTHNGTSTASTCTFNLENFEWLAFIKNTTGANEKWYVMDSLKGTGHYWSTNDTTTPEQSDSNVMSVSGTGFTLLSTLGAKEYLVEFHKLGLAADTASNTSGSINSTATSSNILSGAFVSRYTGTGSNATIGHGLPVAPDFISCKNLVSAGHNDNVYHSSIGATKYLSLYNTNAAGTASTIWNDTEPTTSVFSVGTGSTTNGSVAMVAIGWAGVDFYSSFGSYEGNGNADGPFINMGFLPNEFMIKNIDGAASWETLTTTQSPYNPASIRLRYDTTAINLTASVIGDIDSNGFKLRLAGTDFNGAATTYIYGAWGGQPMTDGSINQGRAR